MRNVVPIPDSKQTGFQILSAIMASYVITGASKGIGLELTRQLLELPASQVSKVFTLTRSDPPNDLQTLIKKSHDRAVHVYASVDDSKSVQKAAQDIESKLGSEGLDVLVNNAGTTTYAPKGMKTVQPEDMAKVFDTNVIGPQRVTSAFLPLLEKGKQKKVINVFVLLTQSIVTGID